MSTNAVAPRTGPRLPAPPVTQSTAIEQSRAVAEVQAAVYVAQQCPRDLVRVEAEIRDVCSSLAVAERAFYSTPRKGSKPITGTSIHLARELARVYGNLDYGVRELRRDDEEGESEIEAFAWDQQTNVRTRRVFQVPHQRMVSGGRTKLTDLGDVYLNNQNVGSRAVRECINALLPDRLVRLADELCRETLEHGDGKPLAERIEEMVVAFGKRGISQTQLEARTGRKRGQWSAGDVGRLRIDWQAITADGIDADELFPSDTLAALESRPEVQGPMIPPRSES